MVTLMHSILILLTAIQFSSCKDNFTETILVVILARNKEHILTSFLRLFENLSYPKNKLSLHITSDHNEDNTNHVLEDWLKINERFYDSVHAVLETKPSSYKEDAEGELWGRERNLKLITLREEALIKAKESLYDFIWFLDVDVFLTDPDVIQKMLKEDKTIVAPMLSSVTAFSNFWGAMSSTYWYKRSYDYMDIVEYEKKGCFSVAVVTSCVFVNLKDKRTEFLSFLKCRLDHDLYTNTIPNVDIIIFALSAMENDIKAYICNKEEYGSLLLPSEEESLKANVRAETKQAKILKIGVETTNRIRRYPTTEELPGTQKSKWIWNPNSSNFDFDKVFCISLNRLKDTRPELETMFRSVNLDVTFFDAVDWREFNASFLQSVNIRQLRQYDKKVMTYGSVAEFMSHYFLWEQVVNNNYKQVIIFEDDVKFEVHFVERVNTLLEEIEKLDLDWEFIYLGRKSVRSWEESEFPDSDNIIKPAYSHWTVGYMLSYEGAVKLLEANPLHKIIPLDDFISVMHDSHPEKNWKNQFKPRDLNTYAITPSVVRPSIGRKHKTYISESPLLSEGLEFNSDGTVQLHEAYQFNKVEL